MRLPSTPRALRFALPAVALVAFGACWFENEVVWVCLNPETGKLDSSIYDENHFVNGKIDPCHCYDPCGPEKSCPILVDAGEPGTDCDAGDGG